MRHVRALSVQLYRVVRNLLVDARYGALLSVDFRGWRSGRVFDALNTDYAVLRKVFAGRIGPSDVLVDVGCRKGRVINWWLRQGFANRMIGVEIDGEIAEWTRRRFRKHSNVTIIAGDILENIPPEGTLFYVYNPFGAETTGAFADRLAAAFENRKAVRVIYFNCLYVDAFQNDPRWEVEVQELGGGASRPFPRVAYVRSTWELPSAAGVEQVAPLLETSPGPAGPSPA